MPAFCHFYPAYTHETYKRIPYGTWARMVAYMHDAHKAMTGR